MRKVILFFIVAIASSFTLPEPSLKLARLKYSGGGNWYVSPTALTNLAKFCNQELGTNILLEEAVVEPASPEIFNYAFIHLTGNGRFVFSTQEAANMRKYLMAGGFLNINDSYDMDKFVRPEMKKVFPELDFVELPFTHPLYHQKFDFPNGLPKIHQHNEKPSQGFALIHNGRVVCFYSYESDIGDGWEDPQVHNDPEEVRQKALKMGANILQFVFSQ